MLLACILAVVFLACYVLNHVLRQGVVIAHDSVANLGKILGESLENTFLHLVDDVDTMHVARDIVEVMKAG